MSIFFLGDMVRERHGIFNPPFFAYDPDALAYFATAGITDSAAKQQINSFVTGVKSLGLWNSMVCWPLRSSQNAGAGATAYSLGGLGSYDAAFAGSSAPTWGANGTTFATGGTNYMTFTDITMSYPFGFSAVANNGSGADASPMLQKSVSGGLALSLNQYETLLGINGVSLNILTGFAGFSTPNVATMMNGRVTGNTSFYVSANGDAETLFTPTTGNFNSAPVNRVSGRRGLETTNLAIALLTSGLTFDNTLLYPLYKSTLGQGLGLP